jgi:hypothetical protein
LFSSPPGFPKTFHAYESLYLRVPDAVRHPQLPFAPLLCPMTEDSRRTAKLIVHAADVRHVPNYGSRFFMLFSPSFTSDHIRHNKAVANGPIVMIIAVMGIPAGLAVVNDGEQSLKISIPRFIVRHIGMWIGKSKVRITDYVLCHPQGRKERAPRLNLNSDRREIKSSLAARGQIDDMIRRCKRAYVMITAG